MASNQGGTMLQKGSPSEEPAVEKTETSTPQLNEIQAMEMEKDQEEGKSMEEAMANELEKLKITTAERAKVVAIEDEDLEKATEDLQGAIFCRILTPKLINPEVFKTFMPRIWNKEGRVRIKAMGRNTYLCNFNNSFEKDRIKRGGPWNYDRALLVIEDTQGASRISHTSFRYVNFWVHIHDLPMVCMRRKWAEKLGNSLGEFVEADLDEGGSTENTLRIQVKIDVSEPLKRGLMVRIGSKAEETWVKVTYERLPEFCYGCGIIGHVQQECEKISNEGEENLYGDFMRATPIVGGTPKQKTQENKRGNFWGRGRGRRGAYQFQNNRQNQKYNDEKEETWRRRDQSGKSNEENVGVLRPENSTEGRSSPEKETVGKSQGQPTASEVSEQSRMKTGKAVMETNCQAVEIGKIRDLGQKYVPDKKATKGIVLKDQTSEMITRKEWASGTEKDKKGPRAKNSQSGLEKEINKALEREKHLEEKEISEMDTNQDSLMFRGEGKNVRTWKRRARVENNSVDSESLKGATIANGKRKNEGDSLAEESGTKKPCIPNFEVNGGISAEADFQPRRTP